MLSLGLQDVNTYVTTTLKKAENSVTIFGGWSQSEKNSEIKPPLGRRRRRTKKIHVTTMKKVLQQ